MIVDIFLTIDDTPKTLRRPIMPYKTLFHNQEGLYTIYRIPLYVKYDPQADNWPQESWYSEENKKISALLIAGARFPYTTTEENKNPPPGYYHIHKEENATYIAIGYFLNELLMYQKIEIIATSQSVFSLFGSKDPDHDSNPPMLLTMPNITQKADALKYARFNFNSLKFEMIRKNQTINLYGGQAFFTMRFKNEETNINEDWEIGKYLIQNIEHDINTIKFNVNDYRRLLNLKFPIDKFSTDECIFLEDQYKDKVKPMQIGIGNGVPLICLNGNQIYQYPFVSIDDKIEYHDFYYPPGLINLYKIEVLNNDRWIEVYPGLGNPLIRSGDNNAYKETNLLPDGRKAVKIINDHILQIYWSQVVENAERGNSIKSVRMYGLWQNSLMENAVKYFLDIVDISKELSNSFSGEFRGLVETGLYMDETKSIFEWIEMLQTSNIIGGQLILKNNYLYFKLDNPNRNSKLILNKSDVLNHETLFIENASDFWYNGWLIEYIKSIQNDEKGQITGQNIRFPMSETYSNLDRTAKFIYNSPQDQRFDIEHIHNKKINILSDLINNFRHGLNNVILPMYSKFLYLELYDVVTYLPKTLEGTYETMDWIIYGITKNIQNETITLTLIERVKSSNWNNGNE